MTDRVSAFALRGCDAPFWTEPGPGGWLNDLSRWLRCAAGRSIRSEPASGFDPRLNGCHHLDALGPHLRRDIGIDRVRELELRTRC